MVGRKKLEEQIRAAGIDGMAKLVQWWIIGKSGSELELVELIEYELEITVTGLPPYPVKHRQLTPFGVFTVLSQGMVFPVKIHPENPKKLLIDWDQMKPRSQVMGAADLPENVLETLRDFGAMGGKKDLKARLGELETAYHAGLITEKEYQKKREDMLKEL